MLVHTNWELKVERKGRGQGAKGRRTKGCKAKIELEIKFKKIFPLYLLVIALQNLKFMLDSYKHLVVLSS